jgi:hypothetical protein
MKKSDLFRKVFKLIDTARKFQDKIPSELQLCLLDNPYSNSIEMLNDLLIDEVFGDEATGVQWFLNDWYYNHSLIVVENGVEYSFADIEDYIKFAKFEE